MVAMKSSLRDQLLFTFDTREEEKKWLSGAWVGLLKQEFPWEDFGEEIMSKSGNLINFNFLGDNVMLMRGQLGKSMEEVSKDLDEWFI
ncbi:hypothetical protein ACS0TY_008245 [Phlomoides rotata]